MAKIVRSSETGERDSPLDPFSAKTLTKIYADCRPTGRPYPLSVFDDLGWENQEDDSLPRAERREKGKETVSEIVEMMRWDSRRIMVKTKLLHELLH